MSRIRNLSVDPTNLQSVVEALNIVVRVLNQEVSFGDPLDPTDDKSLVLAGGTGVGSHNGRPSNIVGTWVELEFEALHTVLTAVHNLGVPVTNNEVNVRWCVMGIRHSGVGAGAFHPISINYQDGDTITSNSIQLRAYSANTIATARTVNAANPIRVSLLFIPVTRWPN